jgi:hypothetical protein
MSGIQRFFSAIFPKGWAESMEADSRSWMVRCRCGCAKSVWEMGGIRWKAVGEQRWFMRCTQCGQRSWHVVSRDTDADPHIRRA